MSDLAFKLVLLFAASQQVYMFFFLLFLFFCDFIDFVQKLPQKYINNTLILWKHNDKFVFGIYFIYNFLFDFLGYGKWMLLCYQGGIKKKFTDGNSFSIKTFDSQKMTLLFVIIFLMN